MLLGPEAEVVASNCEDDVDDPLARELGVLLGIGEVRLHLGVVGRLRQYGPDAAVLVLGNIQVTDLAALNVLFLSADDVCTRALGQKQVLTFQEVDADGVVGREEGLELHGQEAEDFFLGLEARAELGGCDLLFVADFHLNQNEIDFNNYNFKRCKHVSDDQSLLLVNQVCFVACHIYR